MKKHRTKCEKCNKGLPDKSQADSFHLHCLYGDKLGLHPLDTPFEENLLNNQYE